MSSQHPRLVNVGYTSALRPLLFRLDPERAHHGAVRVAGAVGGTRLGRTLVRHAVGSATPAGGPVEVFGLRFANRVGLAAGMDKDGRGWPAWGPVGFGHVEIGTVTAVPQPGNPRPRMARLPRSRAVINRMGFNNAGVHALARRLQAARQQGLLDMPVGVSIGKSKVTPVEHAVEDYLVSVQAVAGLADYLAVNVSSPNTPGLRSLQDAGPLRELLGAVVAAADGTPVLVKLAPDLADQAVDEALQVATDTGVAGIIATNTTLSREDVDPAERHTAEQPGGLSGAPLTLRSRAMVARIASSTDFPVIGVGGIMTGQDAAMMLEAGASLVQLYTGLVYAGPGLVAEVACL